MAVTMRTHFGAIWEAIADAVPDAGGCGSRGTARVVAGVRAACRAAGTGVARCGSGPRLEGRDVPIQLARVLRDELRGDEGSRHPDQRQLPLPRQRARTICSTTPTSRRWCSTRRSATAWPACATGSTGVRLLVEVDDGPRRDGTDARRGRDPLRGAAGDRWRRPRASSRAVTRCTSSTPVARRACRRASCTRSRTSRSSSCGLSADDRASRRPRTS